MAVSGQFRGIAYPMQRRGKELPAKAIDAELIKQSLVQIILTPIGSRVCRPRFGTNILAHLFENNDPLRAEMLKADLIKNISEQEPRISLRDINMSQEGSTLYLNIVYIIIYTQQTDAVQIGLPTTR